MKIIVFGASGKVGRQVVRELLDRDYEVSAFVHSNSQNMPEKVSCIQGDVHDAAAVRNALRNQDVVISALGSWGTKSKDILSTAMSTIVPIMQENGQQRIVSLTGADANLPREHAGAFQRLTHAIFSTLAPAIMHDGEEHLRLLSESNLDWTVIRSPVMRNGQHGTYRLSSKHPLPWQTLQRSHVALAMCDQVEGKDWLRQAPFIS